MKNLWTPWRYDYITSPKSGECVFCEAASSKKDDDDKENLVLFRGTRNFVLLNRYPYSNGHLMIAPYEHLSTPEKSGDKTLAEMSDLMKRSLIILRKIYNSDGFNIGMNLGVAGGAGIEDHYHLHVLPRWHGDTNFMTATGGVRIIPQELDDAWNKLSREFGEAT